MGKLYRRGQNGCWWFAYDGKRTRTPYTDKAAAERWRRDFIADQANGCWWIGAHNATLNDLFDLLERDYTRTGKASQAALASRLRHLRAELGGLLLADLRDSHIECYADDRLLSGHTRPVRPATVNRELEVLRRALTLGARQTPPLIGHVPRIAMLDESDNVRTQIIDHATYKRLIAALPDAERWMTVLAWHIGWRFDRIRTLTWAQVDFERGVLLAPDKQRAGKMVGTAPIYGGMREVLLEALRSAEGLAVGVGGAPPSRPIHSKGAMRDASGSTSVVATVEPTGRQGETLMRNPVAAIPVIHRPDGSPVVDIRKAWARATKAAGCPSLRFHDLRAAAASNLIEAGVPQIEAQKILGHKTAAMFQRYHIVSTDRLAEIGRMVEARTIESKQKEILN